MRQLASEYKAHAMSIRLNLYSFGPKFLILLFLNITVEPGVTVTCRAHEMEVTFEKRIFTTLEARNMSLDATACSASDSPQFISISTALNECGTKFYETGDTIVFSNVVHKDAELANGQITREHDFEFPFNCSYSKTKFLSLQFVPEGRLDVPGVGT